MARLGHAGSWTVLLSDAFRLRGKSSNQYAPPGSGFSTLLTVGSSVHLQRHETIDDSAKEPVSYLEHDVLSIDGIVDGKHQWGSHRGYAEVAVKVVLCAQRQEPSAFAGRQDLGSPFVNPHEHTVLAIERPA